jgi:hypothetical protein
MISIARNVEIEITIFGGHPISTICLPQKRRHQYFAPTPKKWEGYISDYYCAANKNQNSDPSHACNGSPPTS